MYCYDAVRRQKGSVMNRAVRWVLVTVCGVATFALSWWVLEVVLAVPTDRAIGLAALPTGLVGAPLGWWASIDRRKSNAGEDPDVYRRYLEQALSESRSRAIERWRSVGISEKTASELHDNLDIGRQEEIGGQLPQIGFALVQGDFGAGKSLFAERLHSEDIRRAMEDPSAPAPILVDARELRLGTIEDVVNGRIRGVKDLRHLGVRVVVDGLDQGSIATAYDIIENARIFSRSWQNSRVVVTARPGFNVDDEELNVLPLLSDGQVSELMRRLVGDFERLHREDFVADAVKRPLFAIIASDIQAVGKDLPRTIGEFLDILVGRALERSKSGRNVDKILVTVASMTLPNGGTVAINELGGDRIVAQVLDTRLVHRRGRSLAFSLPVVEQYYAARALLVDELAERIMQDRQGLYAWRYAIVIALNISSWERGSRLLSRLVNSLPGLAAWAVHEAVPTADKTQEVRPPFLDECARRIQTGVESWMVGLGRLSGVFRGLGREGRTFHVATGAWGNKLIATLDSRPETLEPRSLAEPINIFTAPAYYTHIRADVAPTNHSVWPWKWSLGWVVDDISWVLSNRSLTADENSAAAREYEWDLIVKLMKQHGIYVHWEVRIDKVLTVVRSLVESLLSRGITVFSVRGLRDVCASRLSGLLSRLESNYSLDPGGYVRRPYLAPDAVHINDRPDLRWAWQRYTQEGIERLAEEVYGTAIKIYSELVDNWFAPLAPTLGLASVLPVRIDLMVEMPKDDDHQPGIDYSFSATSSANGSHVVVRRGDDAARELSLDIWDSDRYMNIRARAKAMRSSNLNWMRLPAGLSAFDGFGDTPAMDLAYKWVKNDLEELRMWHR
jgi:hypothetical protein